MIRYALTCSEKHEFDSWFQSAEAYERLRSAGHINCSVCGSTKIEKLLMAPALRPGRTAEQPALASPVPEVERALVAMRRAIEANSDYVGMNFAAEARAIHDGNAPGRSIYGEARAEEAMKLIEDGVPVARLPFLPRRKVN